MQALCHAISNVPFNHRARRSGLDQAQAAAAAQEAVTPVLAPLETLRDPEALITYTFYVLRTILREQRLIDEESLDEAFATGGSSSCLIQ